MQLNWINYGAFWGRYWPEFDPTVFDIRAREEIGICWSDVDLDYDPHMNNPVLWDKFWDWAEVQPEYIEHFSERERHIRRNFCDDGLAVPGTVVKIKDGATVLIGSFFPETSIHDSAIIERYACAINLNDIS